MVDEKKKEEMEQEVIEEEEEQEVPESEEEDKDERIQELGNQLLRLQADFENFRNRQEKERALTVKYANEALILKILSVVDNFERALEKADKEDAFCQGVMMIHDELVKVLTDAGLEEIPTEGEVFDPNVHHALFAEEVEGVEPDMVTETLQKGYRLNDRVIRPAMVKVSK